ncbi:hypothetical protein C9J12_28895 [Photobacterium frigidiphilum]|uniref:Uncharacterized protein n=1 Tax=Photobacterium frigidiphilum TaxID=264736 RepID=A0A2T3J632_9GAMM|nr:hypothetical protein [Photobacterium frigidiphilum]PSU42611.1 hypothetical protein C9J12_28895 [Photobacterium frigidiphilum]
MLSFKRITVHIVMIVIPSWIVMALLGAIFVGVAYLFFHLMQMGSSRAELSFWIFFTFGVITGGGFATKFLIEFIKQELKRSKKSW